MTEPKRPVALVTGGRRGIGLGIVRALANSGFDVAFTGVSDPSLETDAIIAELGNVGAKSAYFKSDIADLAGHADVVSLIVAQFGGIDCLVNNAGIASVVRGDYLDLKPANFDKIINTNLRGTVFFTQEVIRAMQAGGQAKSARSIINITSVSATMSSPERMDYCITKAALAAFSQSLAVRLAPENIGVFEVRPGIIRTDMTAGVTGKYDALISGGLVPAKRWGEASDIGSVVASLASGAFGFATGSVLNVDGALSISRL
jgi:3-oxoacyl-[acyl-carrier protein] reductase